MLGALVGASGWEADIALTWFTAFASLALMIGFAAKLGGCRLAPLLVVLLSLAASLRPVLRFVLGPHLLGRAFSPGPWPQAWIFQASWAPQHLAAASCVVVAVLIMSRLAAPCSWPLVPLLAIVVAAGFESSTWVGGVIFAAGALPIGVAFLLAERDTRGRIDLVLKGAVAIILVAAISFPFLPRRIPGDGGARCRVPDRAAAVRGARRHAARERFAGRSTWGLFGSFCWSFSFPRSTSPVRRRWGARSPAKQRQRRKRGWSSALPCWPARASSVPWLFASTIANNDLGWRGVLPAVLVLTIFAAAGLSRWLATAPRLAMAAVACWALGVPDGLRIAEENAAGVPAASAAILAQAPELWAAVRAAYRTRRARRQQSAVPCRQRALAGQHFLGVCWPIAAPAMPAGTWRAPSCRCRAGDRPDQCACSSGSLPVPARRRTFATSPPATIVAWSS